MGNAKGVDIIKGRRPSNERAPSSRMIFGTGREKTRRVTLFY